MNTIQLNLKNFTDLELITITEKFTDIPKNKEEITSFVKKVIGNVSILEIHISEILPYMAIEMSERLKKNLNPIKGKKGKVEKLSDDKYNGMHPNGIDEGYTQKGFFYNEPIEGECFYIGSLKTSPVTEVISKTEHEIKFKTLNSTYLLSIDI